MAVVLLVAGLTLVFLRLPNLSDGSIDAVGLSSLLLLASAVVTLIAWGGATGKEPRYLKRVGPDLLKVLPRSTLSLVVVAALSLSALVVASSWPLAFAVVLLAHRIAELFWSWPMDNTIRAGVETGRQRNPGAAEAKALDAVAAYYLETPWAQLKAVDFLLASTGLGICAYYQQLAESPLRTTGLVIACILLGGGVLLHEAVVMRWRGKYFAKLAPLLHSPELDDAPSATPDADALRVLHALYKESVISDQEFAAKKAEILKRM